MHKTKRILKHIEVMNNHLTDLKEGKLKKGKVSFYKDVNIKTLPNDIVEYKTPEHVSGFCQFVRGGLSIKDLYLSKNIVDIHPFSLTFELESLENIYVDPENDYYCDIDGVLFTKDKKKLVAFPKGRIGDKYFVPEGTKIIGENSFSRATITEVVMPSTLERFEKEVFLETKVFICNLLNCHDIRISSRCFYDGFGTYIIRDKKLVAEDMLPTYYWTSSITIVDGYSLNDVYSKIYLD